MNQSSAQQPQRPPKKTNVVLWSAVLLGGMALAGVLFFVAAKSYLDSPAGKHLGMILGPASDAYRDGERAPGAEAVKKAGHCSAASVVDGARLVDLVADGGPGARAKLDLDFVICILPIGGPSPSCDDLADAYVDAVHPTRRFNVQAKHIGGDGVVCGQYYTARGTHTKL